MPNTAASFAIFNMKIGFFDSGLGGLSILKAVVKDLSQYDYMFYGDTEHLPYGDRTEEEIFKLTTIGVSHLFDAGCALVIIACNTASAETARRLQTEFLPAEYPDRKILGIIVPTIEMLQFDVPTRAALLATRRTIESEKYHKELELKGNQNVTLVDIATPELVPLIESAELEAAAKQAIYRIETEAGESEVVILACTHYTQIKEALRSHFLDKKSIVSQDELIPKKLQSYLDNHPEIVEKLTNTGERAIHLTLHRPDYDILMGQFLGGVFLGD